VYVPISWLATVGMERHVIMSTLLLVMSAQSVQHSKNHLDSHMADCVCVVSAAVQFSQCGIQLIMMATSMMLHMMYDVIMSFALCIVYLLFLCTFDNVINFCEEKLNEYFV